MLLRNAPEFAIPCGFQVLSFVLQSGLVNTTCCSFDRPYGYQELISNDGCFLYRSAEKGSLHFCR